MTSNKDYYQTKKAAIKEIIKLSTEGKTQEEIIAYIWTQYAMGDKIVKKTIENQKIMSRGKKDV